MQTAKPLRNCMKQGPFWGANSHSEVKKFQRFVGSNTLNNAFSHTLNPFPSINVGDQI
jgi:hypothetical protein